MGGWSVRFYFHLSLLISFLPVRRFGLPALQINFVVGEFLLLLPNFSFENLENKEALMEAIDYPNLINYSHPLDLMRQTCSKLPLKGQ